MLIDQISDRESCESLMPFGISENMPRIADEMLHGIAFMYPTLEAARENKRTGGTAFLVTLAAPRATAAFGREVGIPFLVSNRHVVWNGGCSVARLNRRDGGHKIFEFGPEHWVTHPDGDDVAVSFPILGLNMTTDEIASAAFKNLLSEEMAQEAAIGIGDDVFMMGRLVNF